MHGAKVKIEDRSLCLCSGRQFKHISVFETVGRRPLTSKVWIQSQASLCGICGGQSSIGTDFPPSRSVFLCQYNSTNAQT